MAIKYNPYNWEIRPAREKKQKPFDVDTNYKVYANKNRNLYILVKSNNKL